jgi:hypothetical protein
MLVKLDDIDIVLLQKETFVENKKIYFQVYKLVIETKSKSTTKNSSKYRNDC